MSSDTLYITYVTNKSLKKKCGQLSAVLNLEAVTKVCELAATDRRMSVTVMGDSLHIDWETIRQN